MRCVKEVLENFYSIFGQRVSNEKIRALFLNNTPKLLRRKLIHMSGFKETKELRKYERMPITGKSPKPKYFNLILENIKNKLIRWKVHYLSFACRMTLAKTVVEFIPTYSMMMCSLSKNYVKEIHKLQKRFHMRS